MLAEILGRMTSSTARYIDYNIFFKESIKKPFNLLNVSLTLANQKQLVLKGVLYKVYFKKLSMITAWKSTFEGTY